MEFISTLSLMSICFLLVLLAICSYGYIVYVKSLSTSVFKGKARWPFQMALHIAVYLWFFTHGVQFLLIFIFIECCLGIEIDKMKSVKDWREQ